VMDIRVWSETGCGDGKFFFALPLFCSEFARDEPENAAGYRVHRVIVDVHREQARSCSVGWNNVGGCQSNVQFFAVHYRAVFLESVWMKISRGFALASLMTLAASPVFAQFSLGDAANAIAGMKGGDQAAAAAPTSETAGLLGALSQLNVTPQQAVGGTGAMLGLAKNQLSTTDYAQLAKSVPGIDKLSGGGELGALAGLLGSSGKAAGLDNALGAVKDTNDLNNAFGALGMDSGMIGQFAPVLLQYLGQQGVGGPLLQSLGSIWGAGTGS